MGRLFLELEKLNLHVRHVLHAAGRVFPEAAKNQSFEIWQHGRHELMRRFRLVVDNRGERLGD